MYKNNSLKRANIGKRHRKHQDTMAKMSGFRSLCICLQDWSTENMVSDTGVVLTPPT